MDKIDIFDLLNGCFWYQTIGPILNVNSFTISQFSLKFQYVIAKTLSYRSRFENPLYIIPSIFHAELMAYHLTCLRDKFSSSSLFFFLSSGFC